jgi:hypothetical protein
VAPAELVQQLMENAVPVLGQNNFLKLAVIRSFHIHENRWHMRSTFFPTFILLGHIIHVYRIHAAFIVWTSLPSIAK